MSEPTADPARFAELEARLHALLREKYHSHWRRKDGKPLTPAEQERLAGIQSEIRAAFDEIRTIDRKYKIPPLRMHEDPAARA
jgi:hypothetical protein